ncbi:hypothetical protein AXY43_23145 [Clostridium sp. MF28]|uniref:hypothetical protein n=1 Tax=Clostridium sp. MF28 TaxID=1702238 RepID=UPI000CFA191E|nr:hypothetical protein [Clostridium sp. MF28]AVK50678.1 hypothetical protein AXY43_23145 [Clostridium sp. MF28]
MVLIVVPSVLDVNATISKSTYTLLEELENKLDQASDFFENIDNAINANNELKDTIADSETAKTNLNGSITTADASKIALDTSNTNATNTKNVLDDLKTSADNTKNDLNTVNQTGQTLLNSLESFENQHADVSDISNKLASVNTQLSETAKHELLWLNCTKFGVLADGIDHTNEMTVLIKYAMANGYSKIYIPSGDYIFSINCRFNVDYTANDLNSLPNFTGIEFIGDGIKTIIHNPINDCCVNISGSYANSLLLRGFSFKNLSFIASDDLYNSCFVLDYVQTFNFENLYVYGFYYSAFDFTDVMDSNYTNLTVQHCGKSTSSQIASMFIYRQGNDVCNAHKYVNCHFENATNFIYCATDYACRHLYFTNCKFEKSYTNNNAINTFYFNNNDEVRFTNCLFVNHSDKYFPTTSELYDSGKAFIYVSSSITSHIQTISFVNCDFATPPVYGRTKWFYGSNTNFTDCKFNGCAGDIYGFDIVNKVSMVDCILEGIVGNRILNIQGILNHIDVNLFYDDNIITDTPIIKLLAESNNNDIKIKLLNISLPNSWLTTTFTQSANGNLYFNNNKLAITPNNVINVTSGSVLYSKFGGSEFLVSSSSTIKNISHVYEGQVIHVIAGSSITLSTEGNIYFKDGSTTKTISANSSISFVIRSGTAYEI